MRESTNTAKPGFTYSPSIEDIAHHETTHAVMEILLYENLERVTIIADEFNGDFLQKKKYWRTSEGISFQHTT